MCACVKDRTEVLHVLWLALQIMLDSLDIIWDNGVRCTVPSANLPHQPERMCVLFQVAEEASFARGRDRPWRFLKCFRICEWLCSKSCWGTSFSTLNLKIGRTQATSFHKITLPPLGVLFSKYPLGEVSIQGGRQEIRNMQQPDSKMPFSTLGIFLWSRSDKIIIDYSTECYHELLLNRII